MSKTIPINFSEAQLSFFAEKGIQLNSPAFKAWIRTIYPDFPQDAKAGNPNFSKKKS